MNKINCYLDDLLTNIKEKRNLKKALKKQKLINGELEKENQNLKDNIGEILIELGNQKNISINLRKELNSYKVSDKNA